MPIDLSAADVKVAVQIIHIAAVLDDDLVPCQKTSFYLCCGQERLPAKRNDAKRVVIVPGNIKQFLRVKRAFKRRFRLSFPDRFVIFILFLLGLCALDRHFLWERQLCRIRLNSQPEKLVDGDTEEFRQTLDVRQIR